jgi:hypothetical protein
VVHCIECISHLPEKVTDQGNDLPTYNQSTSSAITTRCIDQTADVKTADAKTVDVKTADIGKNKTQPRLGFVGRNHSIT